MNISILKINRFSLSDSNRILTIKAKLLKGEPSTEDYVFLRQNISSIEVHKIVEITKLPEDDIELKILFSIDGESNFKYYSKFIEEDDIIFCGINKEVFNNKNKSLKQSYFLNLVEALNLNNIAVDIKKHLNYSYVFSGTDGGNNILKLGGIPSPAIEYPISESNNSIIFLAQIDINKLGKQFDFEYNIKGHLYFFSELIPDDEEDNDCCYELSKVFVKYFKNQPKSNNAVSNLLKLEEVYLSAKEIMTIPSYETLFKREVNGVEIARYLYIDELLEYYNNIYPGVNFLGHPSPLQACVLREAEMFSKEAKEEEDCNLSFIEAYNKADKNKHDWMLLLQIDLLDDYFEEIEGFDKEIYNGSSMMYVLIRKNDFEQLNFENTKTIIQFT